VAKDDEELSRAVSTDNAGMPRSGKEQESYERYVRSMTRVMYIMSALWVAENEGEWQATLQELMESQEDTEL
jgi:hypothetical protein